MTTQNALLTEQTPQSDFIVSHSSTTVAPETSTARKLDTDFVDRRNESSSVSARAERRQFGNSHQGLSDAGKELAIAIDRYKVERHRRYLTCDEMIQVLTELGYAKS